MIDVALQNSTKTKIFNKKYFENIFKATLSKLKLSKNKFEIVVHLVGDSKMKTINSKYRGKSNSTDVLSFPLFENAVRQLGATGDIMSLGEIFISIDTAKNRAKRDNISMREKMNFLTVHGFLHILGYDHEKSPHDEKAMFRLQNQIISTLTK